MELGVGGGGEMTIDFAILDVRILFLSIKSDFVYQKFSTNNNYIGGGGV